ncbi:hypothetical protein ACXR8U_00180 [Methylobacterium radiotolerans]|uniref:hypothetical protein n=1 Tax=Methylobacterium TaxID=407 RepID=UPI0007514C03|nr:MULTISPECIES: hypothetical protein [Methylobacterium]MBN6819997.1 hypothetical protein [Methylobacterium organophilum]
MIRTLRAGFMSVLALVGVSAGARAQFAFEDEVLPPRVVAWRLADRGFSGLSRPRFDGRVYVVDAVGPAGAPVRLFVDPMTGAIVGRRPIGAPETVARLERPAPGFGWTEDEVVPRRAMRPVPSEDGPVARPQRRPAGEAMRPDANPEGVNPDNVGRTAPPKRVARGALARTPELKPPPRTSPQAPAPKLAPADAAKADPNAGPAPETKAASIEKTPAAAPAPPSATPSKPADAAVAGAPKPAAKDWKDPPTDKKPVRVIGGATVVPGQAE